MAMELNLPVVVLSQLNRTMDRRRYEPSLSDLSQEIVQHSDVVIFMSRVDLNCTEDEWDARYLNEGPYPRGVTEIKVAKNRHGDTGKTSLGFDLGSRSYQELPMMIPSIPLPSSN